jgi:N-acetylneuraminic acid mutarotase
MFIFGGLDENDISLNDLYSFDITNFVWQKILVPVNQLPTPRYGHAMCVSGTKKNKSLYIFGGCTDSSNERKYLNDLCCFNLTDFSWKIINSNESNNNRPTARSFHQIVADDNNLYVFGGSGLEGMCDNDMHNFNITTEKWTTFKSNLAPSPRHSPTMTICSNNINNDNNSNNNNKFIIAYGGIDNSWSTSNDLYFYSISENVIFIYI